MSTVLDRPPIQPVVEREEDDPPETAPRRQQQWWRWLFPWVKTAVAAPPDDDDRLLIVNATGETWAMSLGYRNLGLMQPYEHHTFRVVKSGLLSARQFDAPVGAGYLTLSISPAIHGVRIECEVLQGETLYGLSVVERATSTAGAAPGRSADARPSRGVR